MLSLFCMPSCKQLTLYSAVSYRVWAYTFHNFWCLTWAWTCFLCVHRRYRSYLNSKIFLAMPLLKKFIVFYKTIFLLFVQFLSKYSNLLQVTNPRICQCGMESLQEKCILAIKLVRRHCARFICNNYSSLCKCYKYAANLNWSPLTYSTCIMLSPRPAEHSSLHLIVASHLRTIFIRLPGLVAPEVPLII